MSDNIFHEVDEEVRREKLKQLWSRYSGLIVGVAFLVVLSVAGWRGYEYWELQKAAESGAAFQAAIQLVEQGKHQEAEAAFAKVAAEGSSGYRVLARLREATSLARRDVPAAVKVLDALAADRGVGQTMQDLAAVRAGYMLLDTAPLADLTARLEPLTAGGRPFRHSARELLAVAAWRAGDEAAAKRWFDLINTDAETPAGTRARIELLTAIGPSAGKG